MREGDERGCEGMREGEVGKERGRKEGRELHLRLYYLFTANEQWW
jgi:hypothetical protein